MKRTPILVGVAVVAVVVGYLVAVATGPHDVGAVRVADYRPAPHTPGEDLVVPEPVRRALVARARSLWDAAAALSVEGREALAAADERAPLLLTVFHEDGRLLTWQRVDDPDSGLDAKLVEAVRRARGAVPGGDAAAAYLHVEVITYTGRFPNFGTKGLFDNRVYEARATGLVLERGGTRAELPPLAAITRNLGPKGSRRTLASRLDTRLETLSNAQDLTIEVYRTVHVGERYPDRAYGEFFRGNERFGAEDVTAAEVLRRLQLIGQWYRANVRDGEVTYRFDPTTGKEYDKPRTMVRSTMAVWVLNRLAVHLDDPELLALGEQTMKYYFERYFQMEKSKAAGRILPNPKPTKKGELSDDRWTTAGFVCAAALERPDADAYRRECELLMDFMMGKRRADGFFSTRWAHSQYFMPGQALLTLAYQWAHTGEARYQQFLEQTWDAYERPLLDMMHLGDKRYAPYAPAWFTQPATVLWEETRKGDAARAARYQRVIFAINDRVEQWYDMNAEPAAYYDQDGILGPKYGFSGNVSITAASLEALVDAAHVADLSGDSARKARYQRAIRHTIAYLLRLQYTPANTYYVRHRGRVTGGFKTDLMNNEVWMDNVWHLTSALTKARRWNLLPTGS